MMRKVFASNPLQMVILIVGGIAAALIAPIFTPEEMTRITFIGFSVMGVALVGILIWLILGLRQRRKQHTG